MDGINDAGLVAQVNYVPAGDCGWTKGTNPGKPQLTFVVIVRYLLDYAGSVEEAIRLLEEHDVWGVASFECHFLVSDPKESAVIEFVDNRMKVLRGERVLTNFYLERFRESGRHTPHAVGIERYAALKDGLDGVTNACGMAEHLKKAWYSRTYLPDGEVSWPSEMNGDCSKEGFGDVTLDSPLAERRKVFDWYRRRIAEYGANTGHAWHTKHTSVYDIEARSLRITMREDVGETFEFALADGNPVRQGGAR